MSSGGKKGGSKSQITGYRYKMAVHMGLCRGPIDELIQINVGDLVAWEGSITFSQFSTIDKPNLFGGDQKEGGIVGAFKLFMGEATQTIDTVVKAFLTPPVPGWRGVVTLAYNGQVASNNPYPKPWKMRIRRATKGWDGDDPWYPERAVIQLSEDPVVTGEFIAMPTPGQYITINGVNVQFVNVVVNPTDVPIGGDEAATAAEFIAVVNANSVALGNVFAEGTGATVELRGSTARPAASCPFGFIALLAAGGDVHAMNPAHIIYECATNNVWGRGLPRSFLDDTAFRLAADQLDAENFGLCIRWNRQEDIDKFVQTIINHIGAVVYIDRTTGLLTLKLIRNDYNVDDLNPYTFANGLIEITEDESSSNDTTFNEIIVKYNNPIIDQMGMVRVQNLASFQALGTLISTTVEYLGIATASLALRLAQRDLQIQSSNLRRMTVKMNRAGWTIKPGGVFAISAPQRGIEKIVMRAGDIQDGPLTDGTITISAVQDVFSLPETSFIQPQGSLFVPLDRSPRVVENRLVTETTYYDLADVLPSGQLDSTLPTTGFVKTYAQQPIGSNIDYVLSDEAAGESEYGNRTIAGFDAGAKLAASIGHYDTDITFTDEFSADDVAVGQPLLIDDEYMRIDDIDTVMGTATVARGTIDSIPAPHDLDSVIWFQAAIPAFDSRGYEIAEVIHVKLLSRTASDTLDPAIAPVDDITIAARQGKPYPPGNLKINGIPFGNVSSLEYGDIVFTWTHRDRIVEGNTLLEHGAASTGPEPGVTYTIRVYDNGMTLLRTAAGITGDTWTYDTSMDIADGDLSSHRFEIESVRDSIPSFQHYSILITSPAGFDEGFDFNFDGGV